MIQVTVNGEDRELESNTTLAQLVESLGLPKDGIAAAVDRHVVPRTQHATTELTDGCSVEIIRAVGGG